MALAQINEHVKQRDKVIFSTCGLEIECIGTCEHGRSFELFLFLLWYVRAILILEFGAEAEVDEKVPFV